MLIRLLAAVHATDEPISLIIAAMLLQLLGNKCSAFFLAPLAQLALILR